MQPVPNTWPRARTFPISPLFSPFLPHLSNDVQVFPTHTWATLTGDVCPGAFWGAGAERCPQTWGYPCGTHPAPAARPGAGVAGPDPATLPTNISHIRLPSSFAPPRGPAPVQGRGCLRTSVAFFSACSSFSWASLTDSEYFSTSSSVPFSFFCRPCCSSSSCGRDGLWGVRGGLARGWQPQGTYPSGHGHPHPIGIVQLILGPHVLREPQVLGVGGPLSPERAMGSQCGNTRKVPTSCG